MEDFQNWIFNILVNQMCSPGWNLPIQDFIDENCEVFEENEENKLIYTQVFQNFCNLIELMLEQISLSLDLGEGIMVGVLFEALRDKSISHYFLYLHATQDFILFKQIMIKRNIEIEIESIKQLKMSQKSRNQRQEEEDLEMALALSLIHQAECEASRFNDILKEDEELRMALEISSSEFIEEIGRRKERILQEINEASELYKKKQLEKEQERNEEQKLNSEEVQRKIEEVKNLIQNEKQKRDQEIGNIQMLNDKKREIIEKRGKLNELKKIEERVLIEKKIERKEVEVKAGRDKVEPSKILLEHETKEESTRSLDESQDDGESLESRKKRLKDQRELVKRKLREDRERELNQHIDKGGIDFSIKPENVSLMEYEKRKRILEKLKQGNLLPFNN